MGYMKTLGPSGWSSLVPMAVRGSSIGAVSSIPLVSTAKSIDKDMEETDPAYYTVTGSGDTVAASATYTIAKRAWDAALEEKGEQPDKKYFVDTNKVDYKGVDSANKLVDSSAKVPGINPPSSSA